MTEQDLEKISLNLLATLKTDLDAVGGGIGDAVQLLATAYMQTHAAQQVNFNIPPAHAQAAAVERITSRYAFVYNQIKVRSGEQR